MEDGLEAGQAFERILHGRFGQVAFGVKPGGQPYRIACAAQHAYRVAIMVTDMHAKTVGAQIYRCEHPILSSIESWRMLSRCRVRIRMRSEATPVIMPSR